MEQAIQAFLKRELGYKQGRLQVAWERRLDAAYRRRIFNRKNISLVWKTAFGPRYQVAYWNNHLREICVNRQAHYLSPKLADDLISTLKKAGLTWKYAP